jgi:hypothetical protein
MALAYMRPLDLAPGGDLGNLYKYVDREGSGDEYCTWGCIRSVTLIYCPVLLCFLHLLCNDFD